MINNYYTLSALVREWKPDLEGCALGDAYSQTRGELSLAFAHPEREWMLRISVQRPLLFAFRTEGVSKARRNVATLFEEAFDREVEEVRIAERDRMLFFELEGGLTLQVTLFGARANVFLVDSEGRILEAFRNSDELAGSEAPTPRAAPLVDSFEAFEGRWRTNRKTVEQALSSTLPIFDRTLAAEVVHRAGVENGHPEECSERERRALYEAAMALRAELEAPSPRIYSRGRFVETFALAWLSHLEDLDEEAFETVDEAVRLFVRRTLAQRHFRRLYEPVEEALREARDYHRRSAERMVEELASESRADRYERWGHLLMAAQQEVEKGAEEVELADLFGEGEPVTIPLDPALDAVGNAENYYERARRTRRSREEAEGRLEAVMERAEEAEALLEELEAVEWLGDIKAFRKKHARALTHYLDEGGEDIDRVPFRRFPLERGYEVWVGKNARQNDELTFRRAQKYDLWMHARGVPGSHTVLRLPNRDAQPEKRLIRRAAAIAAYYSKARGSSLVPVMVAERKHVRKPSGGEPGAVFVEHEDVVMVEPGLPGQ